MPISFYPRRGHAIAPQALRAILDAPIPAYLRVAGLKSKSKLHELDASVWKDLDSFDAERLGEAVVTQVRDSLRELLENHSKDWLPMPPIGSTLDDLELEIRTYNCLKNQWPECERDLQRLGYKTIGDALKLHSFGIKSLVDLLTSLEALQDAESDASSSGTANASLSKYLQAFASVARSRHAQHGAAPHKPIFLLTLLDIVESGKTTDNFVELNDHLICTFRGCWRNHIPEGHWQENIYYPAYYLVWDGLWQLVKNGQPVSPEQLASTQSLKQLQAVADGGRFAPDLWELLQDKNAIAALRRHVVAQFFDDKRQVASTPPTGASPEIRDAEMVEEAAGEMSEDLVEESDELVEEEESFHDDRLGLLLDGVDDAADVLRERMHRIAWLLHSGYEAHAGAEKMAQIWETLDGLMQSASALEAMMARMEPGQALGPSLDENLTQLAQEMGAFPDASQIRRDDARLSPLLEGLLAEGQSLQEAMEALAARRRDPRDCEATKRKLEELRGRLAMLTQQTVEDELQSVFESLSHQWREPGRKMEILGRRYGWDGKGGATLQEAAEHFGVSRERIRQICQPCEADLKNRPVWTPALDRALHWLEEQTPLPLDEVGPKLKEEGLARSELDLRALRRIASLLQRDVPFEIDVVGETSFVQSVHAHEGDDLAAQILSQARRQVSRWGVATLEDIAASVNEKRAEKASPDLEGAGEATSDMMNQPAPDAVVDAALVERILSAQSDFVLLDASTGWFWLASVTRNGLVSQIEKVLAVAPRVRIADLRAGASRHHRRRGFAPPQRVLLELCRRLPGLGVEGDEVFVQKARKLDWALSPMEQLMADALRAHGPVMTRAELERHCSAAGIPRGTFYTYLRYSPIIEIHARSVYGLRGAPVEPGFIESLEPEWTRRRTRVLTDYGWTTDGKAWLGYTLSEGILNNGVCSVPGAMRRYLQGEYTLWTADNSYIGKWTCGDYQAWGVGPFLRRRGGEPGDILLLVIDITARKVVAELGDENLLEEYQGSEDE